MSWLFPVSPVGVGRPYASRQNTTLNVCSDAGLQALRASTHVISSIPPLESANQIDQSTLLDDAVRTLPASSFATGFQATLCMSSTVAIHSTGAELPCTRSAALEGGVRHAAVGGVPEQHGRVW